MRNFNYLKNLDLVLLTCVVLIFAIGLFFLYSATASMSDTQSKGLLSKQVMSMGVGILLVVLILLVDYQKIIDLAPFIYFASLVLLILVFFIGSERLGAQRWLSLGPLSFQPSEFIKLSYILMLGWYLGHKKDSIEGISNIIVPMLLLGPAFVLILIQPDLGTSLILFPIFFAMVYVAGVNLKYILAVFGVGILSSPFFWQFLKGYQKNRLLVFLNPNLETKEKVIGS